MSDQPKEEELADRLVKLADDDGRVSVRDALATALGATAPPADAGARTDQPLLGGNHGENEYAIRQQIAEAEQSGDLRASIAAKSQLLELRRSQQA